jgi:membrane peptidoglycan carboxypeptidase
MMSSMLSDVLSSGTATAARAGGFRLPAAGKTGSTDDYADAWFIGYTPHIVTGVWFGLDRPAPIMARGFGGTVAVPAWTAFMKVATAGAKADWYAMPPDLEKVAICPLSGARATDACRRAAEYVPVDVAVGTTGLFEDDGVPAVPQLPVQRPRAAVYEDIFPIGTVPAELCPIHNGYGGYGQTAGTSGYTSADAAPTPNVDAALQSAGMTGQSSDLQMPRVPSSAMVRSANPRIYVERVMGPDGIVRIVMKQR